MWKGIQALDTEEREASLKIYIPQSETINFEWKKFDLARKKKNKKKNMQAHHNIKPEPRMALQPLDYSIIICYCCCYGRSFRQN